MTIHRLTRASKCTVIVLAMLQCAIAGYAKETKTMDQEKLNKMLQHMRKWTEEMGPSEGTVTPEYLADSDAPRTLTEPETMALEKTLYERGAGDARCQLILHLASLTPF